MSGRQAVYTELQIRINPALEDIVADFVLKISPVKVLFLLKKLTKIWK